MLNTAYKGYNLYSIVFMGTFRERIKVSREKKGWLQEDLAQEIDVSLSTVQRWEGKEVGIDGEAKRRETSNDQLISTEDGKRNHPSKG